MKRTDKVKIIAIKTETKLRFDQLTYQLAIGLGIKPTSDDVMNVLITSYLINNKLETSSENNTL